MNNIRRRIYQTTLLFFGLFLLFMVEPAFAEDGAREWRPIYDLVMRWINFGILVFLLVKFAGPLILKFLNNHRDEIKTKVERIELEKNEMVAKVQEAKESLENSGPRLAEIKGRIIEQGERRKQEVIEKAQEQSQLMLKNARERINNQIMQARKSLMREMMDVAMDKAIERLPVQMTDEDSNRLIQKYLKAAALPDKRL